MILNLRQLEVFRAIMIAKTVSGAAELLHVSQPGISRLLKYMEYKLGINLFERHKGRLIPTPEGEELFRELEPIYRSIEDLDIVIERITRPDNQQLQIACTPSLANYVLPNLIARIKKQMPQSTVKLESLPNETIAEYIIQRRVDFALAFYDPEHPLVLSEPSIALGLECVVPKHHPLASADKISFKQLLDYPLISYYPETLLGRLIVQAFEKLEQEPDVAVTIRYADEACAMVEQGLGVTVAFEYTAIPQRFPELVSVPMPNHRQRLHFLRHNGVSLPHGARQFYDLARSEIRAMDGDN